MKHPNILQGKLVMTSWCVHKICGPFHFIHVNRLWYYNWQLVMAYSSWNASLDTHIYIYRTSLNYHKNPQRIFAITNQFAFKNLMVDSRLRWKPHSDATIDNWQWQNKFYCLSLYKTNPWTDLGYSNLLQWTNAATNRLDTGVGRPLRIPTKSHLEMQQISFGRKTFVFRCFLWHK